MVTASKQHKQWDSGSCARTGSHSKATGYEGESNSKSTQLFVILLPKNFKSKEFFPAQKGKKIQMGKEQIRNKRVQEYFPKKTPCMSILKWK